jgi:Ca2+-binding EF-hand superfamily protein
MDKSKEKIELLRREFRDIDANNDGNLDFNELLRFLDMKVL